MSVRIERPYAEVYERLADPMTWRQWASGMGEGLQPLADGDYLIRSVDGSEARVRFTPPNAFGVLDHTVFPQRSPPVDVPMRLVVNGSGCELVFTLLRPPGMTDEIWDRDLAWVEKDLQAAKGVLEA